MINQMRIYEVPVDNRGPFLDRFRDHAARLMTEEGFRIQAMWTTQDADRLRFVYLLTWRDETEMRDTWARFMAREDWAAIKAETAAAHGQLVLGIEDMMLTPCAFSAPIGDLT